MLTQLTDRQRGICLMMLAFLMFATLDSCAKYLSQWHETPQIVWARYFGHFVLALVIFAPKGGAVVWRSGRPGLQILRSTLLFTGTVCNFIAVRHLQLAETASIMFTMPIWVVLLSIPLLGERIGPRRILAIAVGFAGVLIIVRPGFGLTHWAVLLSISAALITAFYQVFTRQLAGVDSPYTTQMYTALVGTLLISPVVFFYWTTPSGWAIVAMLAIGLLGGVGHYLFILAHQHTPAPILAPFSYSQILWMTLSGYLVFGDVPDTWTIIGAMVVVGSGLYLLYRERREQLQAIK